MWERVGVLNRFLRLHNTPTRIFIGENLDISDVLFSYTAQLSISQR